MNEHLEYAPSHPGPEIIRFVERAMMRSAAIVHRQLHRGVDTLATVASIAPCIGVFGTLLGIANSFPAFAGQKTAIMAMIFQRLSDACVPAALGLLVAVPALFCYKYLTSQLECFAREMEGAALQVTNLLVLHPMRQTPSPGERLVPDAPIIRDELGQELREDQRRWYASRLAAGGVLMAAWLIQIARYFDNDALALESAAQKAAWYVLFTFGVSWFLAYPVWFKALRRASGVLAVLASAICLAWSVIELVLGEHLW